VAARQQGGTEDGGRGKKGKKRAEKKGNQKGGGRLRDVAARASDRRKAREIGKGRQKLMAGRRCRVGRGRRGAGKSEAKRARSVGRGSRRRCRMGRQVGRAWKATKGGWHAAWKQTRERRRRMGREE
jgi:hypothetical protein